MLKRYYVDCSMPSAPYTSLTTVISSNISHEETATQDGEGPIVEGFVVVNVRLRNSDVLANLDKKLSHLSAEERNDAAELAQEFAHLFPDTPKMEPNLSCMMWMWVMEAIASSTLFG